MKKSYSLCAQLHNLSLEFDSVGFQQALSSAGQGPACSRRWLLLPNKLGSQDKTKSQVLKMHYKSTSRGIQLQHKSISSGFPKWQGDGYVLNTVMNNSVFMYLPDFTRTHPDFSLKAAFFSNHCCFKKKSHGPGDNPCSRAVAAAQDECPQCCSAGGSGGCCIVDIWGRDTGTDGHRSQEATTAEGRTGSLLSFLFQPQDCPLPGSRAGICKSCLISLSCPKRSFSVASGEAGSGWAGAACSCPLQHSETTP